MEGRRGCETLTLGVLILLLTTPPYYGAAVDDGEGHRRSYPKGGDDSPPSPFMDSMNPTHSDYELNELLYFDSLPLSTAGEGLVLLGDSSPSETRLLVDEGLLDNSTVLGKSNGSKNSTAEEEDQAPVTRIKYSQPKLNSTYKSKDVFHPKGMEYLYFLSNMFLRLVNRDEELPEELGALIKQELNQPSLDREQAARVAKELEANWDVLLFHYVGVASLAVLGVLLAVVMPFAGLIFACCRCGGRCGAQEPCYDKKRDPCKRAVLGTFLALLVVVLLIGLVCPFVTNARVETGVHSLPSNFRIAVEDTKLFLNNSHKEVQTLHDKNFKEFQKVLMFKLEKSGELINMELAQVSKAIAIDNLTAIASSLSDIQKDLAIIKNTTLALQEETSYLQSGLSDVANRLIKMKKKCRDIPACRELISNYSNRLHISNNFIKLPNVETKLEEVSMLINNETEVAVRRGKRAFDSIAKDIQNSVRISVPEIKAQIENAGVQLKESADEVHKNFRKIKFEQIEKYISFAEFYIHEYSHYRYWAFFAVCMLLLLITLCFTMGIIFGCCGRRPDEATSCYKTTGATWLMWGVGLTFLFSTIIMVTTSALFLVGSASEILICDPLQDPSNSEVFDIVSEQTHLEKYYPPGEAPLLKDIITRCHRNESLYSVLHLNALDSYMDKLVNYRDHLKLNEKLEQFKEEIGNKIDPNVQILSKEAKNHLRNMAKSSISDKNSWDFYTNILEEKVLNISIIDLAAQLNETADKLPPAYSKISVDLKNDAIFLEGLRRWLASIKTNTRVLKRTTRRLSETLKFNKTSLKVAIRDLIDQAEFAQRYLQVNGSRQVMELVSRFTEDFLADADHYINFLRNKIENEIGKCGPMSLVYNATTSAVCKDILYPFNGYWASLGWCFLFFIPCMIIAVQLASLYRKTEPYSGPLTESHESMYDAYAERDNIPLTSGCDKKQRRRSRDYECGVAPPPVAANYTPEPYSGTHASAPRNDYPPPPPNNDWAEYPPAGGGPPRYTSQPSLSPEYERPPPYYYPGPGKT